MNNIEKIARLLEEDLDDFLDDERPRTTLSDIADEITDVENVSPEKKLGLDAQYIINKKRESRPRGPKGSTLNTLTAIRTVRELVKLLGKIGASLDDWDISWTLDGFQINNIKISISDSRAKDNILDTIKDAYPGARHDFDKNPNVYTFLAIHNRLGDTIRNKLGLQYEAYDDGAGRVAISITNPPLELPVEDEEEEKLEGPEEGFEGPEGGLEGPLPGEEGPDIEGGEEEVFEMEEGPGEAEEGNLEEPRMAPPEGEAPRRRRPPPRI